MKYQKAHNLAPLVDELGVLKAQIAELATRETAIKKQLIEAGFPEVDGVLYRATVNKTVRETLDMDAVRAKLSPQFISANTNVTPVTTVRVVARVAEAA